MVLRLHALKPSEGSKSRAVATRVAPCRTAATRQPDGCGKSPDVLWRFKLLLAGCSSDAIPVQSCSPSKNFLSVQHSIVAGRGAQASDVCWVLTGERINAKAASECASRKNDRPTGVEIGEMVVCTRSGRVSAAGNERRGEIDGERVAVDVVLVSRPVQPRGCAGGVVRRWCFQSRGKKGPKKGRESGTKFWTRSRAARRAPRPGTAIKQATRPGRNLTRKRP